MDSPAAPPASAQPAHDPPAYVYAATDYRPRGAREIELCETASHIDWLYVGALVLLDAGSITLDSKYLDTEPRAEMRLIGPALMGLTWGATLGGGYLAYPKCSPNYVSAAPAEGGVRQDWQLALAFALLAGATAPIIVGVETGGGPVTSEWRVPERSARIYIAGATGFFGALLPYLLPPRTWRAAKELERIRAGGDTHGAFFSYVIRF